MDRFAEVVKNRHDYAREWKQRTGGRVMGYFCTYMPEEILIAAGMMPVRILGSHEPQDVTERHIYSMFCPFCRDCLAQGLKGRFEYLDGIGMAHTCLHIRQAYSSWVLHVPTKQNFSYYISMPAKPQSPRARPFLIKELEAFKKAVEEWIGRPVTNKDLDKGIEVMNTNRRLMRQIYELRKADKPLVTGTECMQMVCASQCMDKEEHNKLLAEFIKNELPKRTGRDAGTRLMIIGSEDDDTEFLAMAESLGATVVADDHCTGSRYFWNEAPKSEDRIAAIADRYIAKVPCPEKDWEERRRWTHISKLVDEYKVQGALMIQQKFCDPHEFDIPPLMKMLKEKKNVPSLFLEFDVTVPVGQFRTRVEAFLETMQLEM
ncbi:MAG: 2-hydroxyacyl-CoA dehydratase [Chloroflexi bacterium]|nr:2-hydroxyacyl-CoA dehydratase [Chloroflexota bacterium]